MDKYTIFEQGGTAPPVTYARDGQAPAVAAQRDLEAALQLLAERAQYLTGASGAAIALCEGGEMVCRASAGPAAPAVGVEIATGSGLTAESIRTCLLVRSNPAEGDPLIERENGLRLAVKSAMTMPLLREQEVVGVFELVAERTSAFGERDMAALARLSEMALIASEHADAAKRTFPELSEAEPAETLPEKRSGVIESAEPAQMDPGASSTTEDVPRLVSSETAQIGSCEACGFPVSQGRALCVDCEQAGRAAGGDPARAVFCAIGREEGWLEAHSYTIGTVVIAALTLALLAFRLR